MSWMLGSLANSMSLMKLSSRNARQLGQDIFLLNESKVGVAGIFCWKLGEVEILFKVSRIQMNDLFFYLISSFWMKVVTK